jgi:hypothetical protein
MPKDIDGTIKTFERASLYAPDDASAGRLTTAGWWPTTLVSCPTGDA